MGAQPNTDEHGNASANSGNLTLLIGDALLERLKARAKKNERSLSAEARLIFRDALEDDREQVEA